jgi:hypothetical protein
MTIGADDFAAILNQLDDQDWEFKGSIHRIVHQGGLPLFKGGSLSLKLLGHVRLRPAFQTERVLLVPYRMVFPARRFDPNHRYSASGLQNHALIVNRSLTAAVKSDPWYPSSDDAGVASTWRNSNFQFPLQTLSKWPADELEGATIHIFTTHPVASVNMTLPPPER